jgi:ferric-dicitrate binding protein FerR (iron transport regulator)
MKDEQSDPVGALVRSAGLRTSPDADRFERARQAMHSDWQGVVARRRNTQRLRLAAALVAVALLAGLVKTFWPAPIVAMATVDRVVGDVFLRHVEEGHLKVDPLRAGQLMRVGTELDTGARGRVLLKWMNGAQLRLDQYSVVELKSAQELRLRRGAVYIETDTRNDPEALPLAVTTPFGTARHVGTRFEVRVTDDRAQVRVREGKVSFSASGRAPVTIEVGQQLSAANGELAVAPGPGSADTAWNWLQNIAPSFAIEGRSLFDALEWLGHESGLHIVYASEDARAQARTVILRGSVEGLDTHKALIAVLAGSGLVFDVRADRVEIRSIVWER